MKNKKKIPTLTAAQSKRRVKELEKKGYETKQVKLPGGVAVLKRKKKKK